MTEPLDLSSAVTTSYPLPDALVVWQRVMARHLAIDWAYEARWSAGDALQLADEQLFW